MVSCQLQVEQEFNDCMKRGPFHLSDSERAFAKSTVPRQKKFPTSEKLLDGLGSELDYFTGTGPGP